MAKVFFSYSHADEALRDQLEKQLSLLKRQGIVETWHDRRIGAGQEFGREIDQHVETDDIILLLVSADFIDSDYCYNLEMRRAMERHEAGDAIVIPVILRPCDWHGTPFGKLNATPPDGRAITLSPNLDQALLEVAKAVRGAAERLSKSSSRPSPTRAPAVSSPSMAPATLLTGPRSSALALARAFTERDKDKFKLETFEYIAKYFENSAAELATRNPGIEANFRRIDANRFSTIIYREGQSIARCSIFMGERPFASGIAYSSSDMATNGYNEALNVEADDQSLFLTSMGMAAMGGQRGGSGKLTQEGAAEFYWQMLIRPLQPRT
jgi:hypothetical protein